MQHEGVKSDVHVDVVNAVCFGDRVHVGFDVPVAHAAGQEDVANTGGEVENRVDFVDIGEVDGFQWRRCWSGFDGVDGGDRIGPAGGGAGGAGASDAAERLAES